jgi:hypothetical protein
VVHVEPVADHRPAGVVGPPLVAPRQPLQRDIVFERQVDDRLGPGRRDVEALGLADPAGEAVEDVAAVGRRLRQRLGHHRHHQLVGDERAPVEVGPDLAPQVGAGGHLGPQHLAGRQERHPEPLGQHPTLGALSRSRRTEQNQTHPTEFRTDGDHFRATP